MKAVPCAVIVTSAAGRLAAADGAPRRHPPRRRPRAGAPLAAGVPELGSSPDVIRRPPASSSARIANVAVGQFGRGPLSR